MKQCPICDAPYTDENTTCSTDGALLIEIHEWAPGSLIRNKYRILGKIGLGGMGIVYKAEHLVLEEIRALKVMNPSLATDPKFLRRFRQEAQAARKLQHANIVHVDDCEQADDGSLFIAMDYVEGVTLRQLLRATSGPLPIARALAITRGVANALASADALGMVHRDIKPENILLARDRFGRDVPKVTDFGIAALRESAVVSSTRPLLTPAYASPEQWRGMPSNELDGRADLYALGVTLYEMLAGRLPFHAHTDEGWMRAHLDEQPLPPSRHNPELAQCPGLDPLVLKLLSKNRDDRYANGLALLQELNLVEAQSSWDQPTIPARTPRTEPQGHFGAPVFPTPSTPATSTESPTQFFPTPPTQTSPPVAPTPPSQEVPSPIPPSPAPAVSRGLKSPTSSVPAPSGPASRSKFLPVLLSLAAAVLLLSAIIFFGPWRKSSPASNKDQLAQVPSGSPAITNTPSANDSTTKNQKEQIDRWKTLQDTQEKIAKIQKDVDAGRTAPQDKLYRKWDQYVRADSPPSTNPTLPKGSPAADDLQTGDNYYFGKGVPLDYAEALKWYRKAADEGSAEGQYNVGSAYLDGQGVPKNGAEALRWYVKSANQGYAPAENDLGAIYQNGELGVTKNDTEAVKWYRKAAEQGSAIAQNNLGVMYHRGRGVAQNPAEAASWYRKAAEQGNSNAQTNLGEMYGEGQGVPLDFNEAVKWLVKAAYQDNVYAQKDLGEIYEKGKGVPQNFADAVKWYRKAADLGDSDTQTHLGYMYYSGTGVPQDLVEARKLYLKAAEQGNIVAEYGLGLEYMNGGPGVSKDNAEAYKWLYMVRSDADAAKDLAQLKAQMTPEQVAEAESRAKDWLAQHLKPQK
jgi:TPR repeat protein/tRNA A-37 threonylcarbamoyl transferase component Bud32